MSAAQAKRETGHTGERIEGSYMVSERRMAAIQELVEAAEAVVGEEYRHMNVVAFGKALDRLRTALEKVSSET